MQPHVWPVKAKGTETPKPPMYGTGAINVNDPATTIPEEIFAASENNEIGWPRK
jgi:hypothetical protein